MSKQPSNLLSGEQQRVALIVLRAVAVDTAVYDVRDVRVCKWCGYDLPYAYGRDPDSAHDDLCTARAARDLLTQLPASVSGYIPPMP